MDPYHRFLEEYVREAIVNSNGTNAGIAEYLWAKKGPGRFASNKEEKIKALTEARRAFDEYRHWPLFIILSHLGFEDKESFLKKES
jgi:hypothetical protein